VIPLGLRLAVSGGREAITRLVILTIAVGLGVGLLLTAVAAINAVSTWNGRHAWFWTGSAWSPAGPATGAAPLWWHPSNDTFDGQTIDRFDVAATGASSPVPPGISHDPGPGQYYASPALVALLRTTPANQLADRYPGHLAGTIGDAALPSPNSLVLIDGRTPAQLAHTPDSVRVTSIATTVVGNPGSNQSEVNPQGLTYLPADGGAPASATDIILSVVALAILAPVLIFIGTATRLSAARREERFAAMRLVGATRKQVSLLAATESTVAATLGAAAGFGIFFLLRTPVAAIPFIGAPFFPSDLALSSFDVLVVAIGVPLAAAAAARLSLRRVHISPLGVARRATPKPPGAWRVVPLLAGLAELGYWTVHGHPASISGQVQAFTSSFAIIIVGVFIAGPWLTMAAAQVMARWTSRPDTLIAARRIADDPKAAFRAVSGLVLALFITTVTLVAISTQDAKDLTRFGSVTESHVLTDQVSVSNQVSGDSSGGASQGTAAPGPAAPVAPLTAQLSEITGVQGVLVVRADPGLYLPNGFHGFGGNPDGTSSPVLAGVVSCAQLATVPGAGRCPAGHARRGRHRRADGRQHAGDRACADATGERPRVSRGHHPLHHRRPRRAGQRSEQRLPAARERGDPGQPADRRLHPGGGHRGRARGSQAAVQPAAAHRSPARHAAPRRRAGRRRAAARRRRRRDRHRVRRRRDVRVRGAESPDGGAQRAVLLPRRGRAPSVPWDHRGHLPAAGTHHWTRGREKRLAVQCAELSRVHSAAMGRAASRSPKESCCSPA